MDVATLSALAGIAAAAATGTAWSISRLRRLLARLRLAAQISRSGGFVHVALSIRNPHPFAFILDAIEWGPATAERSQFSTLGEALEAESERDTNLDIRDPSASIDRVGILLRYRRRGSNRVHEKRLILNAPASRGPA